MGTKAIKWTWHLYALYMDEFDSLEAAVSAAAAGEDSGNESVECIEVIENGERQVIEGNELDALVGDVRKRQEEDDALASGPFRPIVATVIVTSPVSAKNYQRLNYVDTGEAEAAAERYRGLLGEDRVEILYGDPLKRTQTTSISS